MTLNTVSIPNHCRLFVHLHLHCTRGLYLQYLTNVSLGDSYY